MFKGYVKEVATACKSCKESFEVKPRYTKKRALCGDCFKKMAAISRAKQKKKNKVEDPIYTRYRPYLKQNREKVHRERAKLLRGMVERAEWLEYFRNRWDEIRNETPLWEFITRDMEQYKERKKHKSQYTEETFDEYDSELDNEIE